MRRDPEDVRTFPNDSIERGHFSFPRADWNGLKTLVKRLGRPRIGMLRDEVGHLLGDLRLPFGVGCEVYHHPSGWIEDMKGDSVDKTSRTGYAGTVHARKNDAKDRLNE